MKRPILFILSFLLSAISFGQNYNPLTPGVNRYFVNSEGHLRGMRIDSVISSGGNTIYYPFHSLRGNYNISQNTTLDPNGGSWFGKNIIELPNGTFLFDNIFQDTVMIKTQAHTGDSWVMYNDTTQLYYQAVIISEDTATVSGVLDSIKTIRITANNNIGQVNIDPINNMEIKLSKDHGFTQILDFHTFPYHRANQSYQQGIDYYLDFSINSNLAANAIYNIIDFEYPTQKELYDWNVGDVFQYKWTYGISFTYHYLYDSVIAKTINGNDITYTVTGQINWTDHDMYGQVFYTTTYFTNSFTITDSRYFNPSLMPEEYHNPYAIYYDPENQDNCTTSASYSLEHYFIHDSTYVSGLVYFPSIDQFKKGLGRTDFYYFDGNPALIDTTLIYYHHNNVICGNFLALDVPFASKKSTIVISPNPCSDHIRINSPDLRNKELSLIDVYGRNVKTIKSTNYNEDVDVSNYASGVYYLQLRTEEGEYLTEKLTIQH